MAKYNGRKKSKPNPLVSLVSPIASVTGLVVKNNNLKYLTTGLVVIPVLGMVFFPNYAQKLYDWNQDIASKIGGALNFNTTTTTSDDETSWDDWGDDDWGESVEVG